LRLDLLLLLVVALLLLGKPGRERLDLGALGTLQVRRLRQLGLERHLLAAVLVLANDLRLVERPLVGGLLLGEQHLLRGVVAAERSDGEHDRIDGGGERGATAKGRLAALLDLVRAGNLDLIHATRCTLGESPRAWRRARPRTRS